jgi:hypothetical protein
MRHKTAAGLPQRNRKKKAATEVPAFFGIP